jgi:hypothetical protein
MAAQHALHQALPRTTGAGQSVPDAYLAELQQMPDVELAQRARDLRADALRGAREARGQAHLCEAELRRRHGAGQAHNHQNLDLRPLDARGERPPWWVFW